MKFAHPVRFNPLRWIMTTSRAGRRVFSVAALGCLLPWTVGATVLDLRAPAIEALDGGSQFSVLAGDVGIEVAAAGGVLNRTASGFGVNAPGGGDDADGIDGGAGPESVTFRFDAAVLLLALEFSGFGRDDVARLSAGSHPRTSLSGDASFGSTFLLAAGEPLLVGYVAGNGFSLDAVEFATAPVSTSPTHSVPGPATSGLLAAGLLATWGFRQRQRARNRASSSASPVEQRQ